MRTNIRTSWLASASVAVALIGSLHAPLFADESQKAVDEIKAEVVIAGKTLDQAAILAQTAEAAVRQANANLTADIVIDLNAGFGPVTPVAVAYNEVNN